MGTDTAQEMLEAMLGPEAGFHEGQLEAIEALVDGRNRVLLVQRTGWGKSVVYFIATRLLRDEGLGPTILISPLVALMRDQVRMAKMLGVRAKAMNHSTKGEWDEIEAALAEDEIDLLMVTPERLAKDDFREKTIRSIPKGIGLFVVDEAHCISDWGHDFRPDYRRIRRITERLPANVPLLATTATANDRVVADVEEQLGPDLRVVRGPLARASLHMQAMRLDDQAERLAWLARYLSQSDGSGVVYTLTVRDAKRVSEWLLRQGIEAPAYYGGLDDQERRRLEKALRDNEVKALVATVALGMGFDKPDLAFVVHFQRPGSVIDYYQQIGRAGRAIDRAEVILLTGAEDDEIADYFIGGAFPPEEVLDGVLGVLEGSDGARMKDLLAEVNATKGTIKQALKTLEVEGAVARTGSGWTRTPNEWELDSERVEAVTAVRRAEQQRMRELVDSDECLMVFVTRELDDEHLEPCERCANCSGPIVSDELDPDLVLEAVHYLRRSYRPIEPRRQWPAGLDDRSGNIPEHLRLQEGRALAVYGDAGWGRLVREGKYGEGGFSGELVEAMAEMIGGEWEPNPSPTWVTAVPSRRNPTLVEDFARRLAGRLGLPYRRALEKVRETPPQKDMENSVQQARNAISAFATRPEEMLEGPVLLVDDMVDSRWSLTVCGSVLIEAGSGPVYPAVLGQTSKGSG